MLAKLYHRHLLLSQYDAVSHEAAMACARLRKYLVMYIILLMTMSQLAGSIYLPSMPAMCQYFHTSALNIQLTLVIYLTSYGVSQFFYGALSDIYGRRLIILVGMGIFLVGCFLTLIAKNIEFFFLARLLQGLGMGCGDTMGRAILCDRFQKEQFVKAASTIGMAATLTPLAAPVLGGYLQMWFDWRASFWVIFLYGIIISAILFLCLPETNIKTGDGHKNSLSAIVHRYYFILTNKIFLGFFIPGLICFVCELLYNLNAPFLLQMELHVTPQIFGWLAMFPVVGLLCGAIIAKKLSGRIAHDLMVFYGLVLLSLASFLFLLPCFFNIFNILVIIVPLMIFMVGVSFIYPNTNMGALTPFSALAGTAGALQGGLQMLGGGFVSVVYHTLIFNMHQDSQWALALAFCLISFLGLYLFVKFLSAHKN